MASLRNAARNNHVRQCLLARRMFTCCFSKSYTWCRPCCFTRLSYTWINHERKSVHLPAPTYIDYVMTWIQNLLNDEATFPTKAGNCICVIRSQTSVKYKYRSRFPSVISLNSEARVPTTPPRFCPHLPFTFSSDSASSVRATLQFVIRAFPILWSRVRIAGIERREGLSELSCSCRAAMGKMARHGDSRRLNFDSFGLPSVDPSFLITTSIILAVLFYCFLVIEYLSRTLLLSYWDRLD